MRLVNSSTDIYPYEGEVGAVFCRQAAALLAVERRSLRSCAVVAASVQKQRLPIRQSKLLLVTILENKNCRIITETNAT